VILVAAIAGVSGWAAFLLYATNSEKVSSSVVRQIMRTVQQNADVRALLGDGIRAEPAWYLNGDPRIQGQVRMPCGSPIVASGFRFRSCVSFADQYVAGEY
jgi:cytochrome c oxidase assembly factor 1